MNWKLNAFENFFQHLIFMNKWCKPLKVKDRYFRLFFIILVSFYFSSQVNESLSRNAPIHQAKLFLCQYALNFNMRILPIWHPFWFMHRKRKNLEKFTYQFGIRNPWYKIKLSFVFLPKLKVFILRHNQRCMGTSNGSMKVLKFWMPKILKRQILFQ